MHQEWVLLRCLNCLVYAPSVRMPPVIGLGYDFESAAFKIQNAMQETHSIVHWQAASCNNIFDFPYMNMAKEALKSPDGLTAISGHFSQLCGM